LLFINFELLHNQFKNATQISPCHHTAGTAHNVFLCNTGPNRDHYR
jgi:hypothetical protein